MDDLDLDQLLLQLEELLHLEVYLLLVSTLELLGTIDVRVVQVRQLDTVFTTKLLDLTAETVDAVTDIIDDAVFLQLQF